MRYIAFLSVGVCKTGEEDSEEEEEVERREAREEGRRRVKPGG